MKANRLPLAMKTSLIFRKTIEEKFDGFFATFGFTRVKSNASENSFSVIYRSDQLYIDIGGSLYPQDYPYYLWLKFGEGSDEFPESDWNGTALWRIVQEVAPSDYAKEINLYKITANLSPEQIEEKVRALVSSCETHGASFLKRELDLFRRIRASQNKGREPYKLYVPTKQGGYNVSFDEKSRVLKEKFSK